MPTLVNWVRTQTHPHETLVCTKFDIFLWAHPYFSGQQNQHLRNMKYVSLTPTSCKKYFNSITFSHVKPTNTTSNNQRKGKKKREHPHTHTHNMQLNHSCLVPTLDFFFLHNLKGRSLKWGTSASQDHIVHTYCSSWMLNHAPHYFFVFMCNCGQTKLNDTTSF